MGWTIKDVVGILTCILSALTLSWSLRAFSLVNLYNAMRDGKPIDQHKEDIADLLQSYTTEDAKDFWGFGRRLGSHFANIKLSESSFISYITQRQDNYTREPYTSPLIKSQKIIDGGSIIFVCFEAEDERLKKALYVDASIYIY